jgi:hypothetical protein
MPGFFGIFSQEKEQIAKNLQSMKNGFLEKNPTHSPDTLLQPTESLGVGLYGNRKLLHCREEGTCLLIIDGEFFTDNRNKQIHENPTTLLNTLKTETFSNLSQLNGLYTFLFFDKSKSQLILGTDRFSGYPLYYSQVENQFAFSSELKGLLGLPWISKDTDFKAFAQILSLGHFLGDHTYWKHIKRVPPGSVLIANKKTFSVKHYWSPKFEADTEKDTNYHLESVLNSLLNSTKRRADDHTGLILSGGIDSRMLAAALPKEITLPALSFGIPGASDIEIAQRVTENTSLTLSTLPLDHSIMMDFYNNLQNHLITAEGVPGLYGTYLKKVHTHLAQSFDFILEGTGGEITRRSVFRRFAYLQRLNKNFRQPFSKYVNHLERYKTFFQPDFYNLLNTGFQNALHEALLKIDPKLHIDDFLDTFYLRERVGNLYSMGNNYQKHTIRCRLPFFDYDFIDSILTTPAGIRKSHKIPLFIIQTQNAKLCKIPIVKGSLILPMKSTFLRTAAYTLWSNLVNGGFPLFAKCFRPFATRPYTDYTSWMRKEWRKILKNVFHDPNNFSKPYYNKKSLIAYVDRFLEKKENDGHILSNLLTLNFIYGTWLK